MLKRYLTDVEKEYYARRDLYLESISKDMFYDAPSLALDRVRAQSMVTRYEMYKRILDIPGDIIELGVYKGNSFSWLAHMSVILEPFAINRRLIGFDTFSGFASIDPNRDNDIHSSSTVSEADFSDTHYQSVKGALDCLDLVRPVNQIPRFDLVQGDIVKTLPEYLNKHPWMTCALLILDTDLYLPTKIALECVLPIMPKGAIILFDEYNYQKFPGETEALKEIIPLNDLFIRKMPYESCSAYAVV